MEYISVVLCRARSNIHWSNKDHAIDMKKFEDTKEVNRRRKSKDGKYNTMDK